MIRPDSNRWRPVAILGRDALNQWATYRVNNEDLKSRFCGHVSILYVHKILVFKMRSEDLFDMWYCNKFVFLHNFDALFCKCTYRSLFNGRVMYRSETEHYNEPICNNLHGILYVKPFITEQGVVSYFSV